MSEEDDPVASMASEGDELIPGLPDSVVLQCVLPRLPWYSRAVLTATSKPWRSVLQQPHIYSDFSRQVFKTSPREMIAIIHQLSGDHGSIGGMGTTTKRNRQRAHALSIIEACDYFHPCMHLEEIVSMRMAPVIPACAPLRILNDCGVASINGKIFVMGGWDPVSNALSAEMFMLDIGAGLWMWERMAAMNSARAFFHCISGTQSIYAIGGISVVHNNAAQVPEPEVYHMETGAWAFLPRPVANPVLHYNDASLIKGTNLLLVHGLYMTERGEPLPFKRVYDPVKSSWSSYCESYGPAEPDYMNDKDVRVGEKGRRDISSALSLRFQQIQVMSTVLMK
ncbi:hypothetical protein KP509_32G009300 [Ceratopteris richardii]|uniref:F-box domain-containing protein n=1 Tax=Ceratopteris richardii TaxID=49495 RepID=A0A8T2QSA9_CERRI|nr:hypothetical protein KP509_32G009300 [Ceratopteris richardii]